MLGAVVFGTGYALLALSGPSTIWLFYLALVIIIMGNGFFKANISVLVGNLYEEGSPLKDNAYNIFYMGINVGAFIAPLAATALKNIFGNYNVAFAAAAIGMVFSLIIFEAGKKLYIHAEDKRHEEKADANYVKLTKAQEKERIGALMLIFAIVIFFWMSFHQNGFALTLFAQRSTIRLEWLRPETYAVFNPLFILLLTPLVIFFWSNMRKRGKEPITPAKIGLGMLISGLSMLVMVAASLVGGNQDLNNMFPGWLISTYFVITIGELLLSPMGLSFVSKVAPGRLRGLMMGCWFGATAIGNYLSGFIGKFYSTLTHDQFFLILAVLLFLSALMIRLFLNRLKHATEGA
jgi:POT family proton-dependent oligopeptide transporter